MVALWTLALSLQAALGDSMREAISHLRPYDVLAALTAGVGTAGLAQVVFESTDVAFPVSVPRWWLLLILPLASLAGIAVTACLQARLPVLFEVAKFGLVGAFSTTIDLGVLNFLMEATGIFRGSLFPVLKGMSFLTALINAFFWNRLWTFAPRTGTRARRGVQQFFLFATVALGGLVLNVTVATLLVNLVALPAGWQPIQWANVAALTGLVGTATWDFLCYKFIVFRPALAKKQF